MKIILKSLFQIAIFILLLPVLLYPIAFLSRLGYLDMLSDTIFTVLASVYILILFQIYLKSINRAGFNLKLTGHLK